MAGLNLFTNNASTTLASNVLIGATSLTVAAGTGSLFPALAGSQYFYCTLTNAAATIVEIVKVTARSSDTFTIVRGQDNTSAQAWTAGDKVELRLTAADLQNFPQLDSTNTFAAAQTFSATPVFSAGITSTATPVGVTSGGTGLGTLTANNVILGAGTSTPTFVAPGTNGNVLSSNGTTWVSTTPASGARSGADYLTLSSGTPNITLTSSSNQLQVVTATAEGQSITLPDMTTCTKGSGYFVFYNTSAYSVAVKDTGGTVREYLYPSVGTYNGSPISGVPLNIENISTANGVWHLQNPISAGSFGTSTAVTTAVTFTSIANSSLWIIPISPTQYMFFAYDNATGLTPYVKLGTLNTSTKAFTFGSQTTLSAINSLHTASGLGFVIDWNGTDRGLIAFQLRSNPGTAMNTDVYGFAIVAGVLYFSSRVQISNGSSATNFNYNTPTVIYSGSNNGFVIVSYCYSGGAYNSYNISAYTVGLSGTTVSLTAATGNGITDNNSSSYPYAVAPTSQTTFVMDDTNNTIKKWCNYNSSTNTLTSGSRTSQTTIITTASGGGLISSTYNQKNSSFIIAGSGANAGKYMYNNSIYTVTNAGTATVTVTSPSVNIKAFPAKSYASITALDANTSIQSPISVWSVSSSSYNILGSSLTAIYNTDPTNANWNFNQASITLPVPASSVFSGYISSTQVAYIYSTSVTTVGANINAIIVNPASPFVS
jgi:hypothetical protein